MSTKYRQPVEAQEGVRRSKKIGRGIDAIGNSANGVQFIEGEPPTSPTGRGRYSPVVKALKKRPGVWAIVFRTKNSSTAQARGGQLKRLGCEYHCRTVDGERLVYARWPEDSNGV